MGLLMENDLEDIIFNDIDEPLDWMQDEGVLYQVFWPSEGYDLQRFHVVDMWEATRAPSLYIQYQKLGQEMALYLYFEGEEYKIVKNYVFKLNGDTIFDRDNVKVPISYFLDQNEKGDIIDHRTCISRFEKFKNLIVFT
jgi:hypothetical protein